MKIQRWHLAFILLTRGLVIRLGEGSLNNLMIVDFPSLSPQRLRSEVGRGQPFSGLSKDISSVQVRL